MYHKKCDRPNIMLCNSWNNLTLSLRYWFFIFLLRDYLRKYQFVLSRSSNLILKKIYVRQVSIGHTQKNRQKRESKSVICTDLENSYNIALTSSCYHKRWNIIYYSQSSFSISQRTIATNVNSV